jgi:hypothetical protein
MKTEEEIAETVVGKYKMREHPLDFGDVRHGIWQFRSELSKEGYQILHTDNLETYLNQIEARTYVDQRVRLLNAVTTINTLITEATNDGEVTRLMGKREGLNVALSYVNEEIRKRQP